MAQVERSSSHTKTSEFWSLLTLFLRQPPNYTQLCGRIFKKNPPTPFCPHPAPKSLYKGEPLCQHMKQLLHVQNIILGAVDDDGDYAGDGADDNYDADANCDYDQDYEC